MARPSVWRGRLPRQRCSMPVMPAAVPATVMTPVVIMIAPIAVVPVTVVPVAIAIPAGGHNHGRRPVHRCRAIVDRRRWSHVHGERNADGNADVRVSHCGTGGGQSDQARSKQYQWSFHVFSLSRQRRGGVVIWFHCTNGPCAEVKPGFQRCNNRLRGNFGIVPARWRGPAIWLWWCWGRLTVSVDMATTVKLARRMACYGRGSWPRYACSRATCR